MSQGFYELLGVEPDADSARIRQAYQARLARLVRRLRTARQKGADVTLLEAQERALREAREVLSEPARRRRYDAFRSAIDGGLPESAGALWEQVQTSIVAPEVSLALATVQALTELPVGQPVPPPPQPVRVQRADPELKPPQQVAGAPGMPHVPGLAAQRGPDRPTLVPATDPGIEISLSQEELSWLEQPARPAPLHPHQAAGVVQYDREATDLMQGPTLGDAGAAADGHASPATWSEEADTRDDLIGVGPDAPTAVAEVSEVEEGSALPGLGFLSRLSLPKAPNWGSGGAPASSPPESEPEYTDNADLGPVELARHRYGATGPFLLAVREERGMSLDDLSRVTRISSRYLEAIEANAFDRLPSATFVKGYVKQVVEHLEIDGHGVVEAFMAAYRSQRG